MTQKIPIVSGKNGGSHTPLAEGETLPPSSIPVSAKSGNAITVESDGLFAAAGGGSGGGGADGKSAYEIWLAQGNSGTEQDFLNSLRGVGIKSVEISTEWE